MSPSAAAMSAGSPSSSAASKYAAMSPSVVKCSAGSHGRVFIFAVFFLMITSIVLVLIPVLSLCPAPASAYTPGKQDDQHRTAFAQNTRDSRDRNRFAIPRLRCRLVLHPPDYLATIDGYAHRFAPAPSDHVNWRTSRVCFGL